MSTYTTLLLKSWLFLKFDFLKFSTWTCMFPIQQEGEIKLVIIVTTETACPTVCLMSKQEIPKPPFSQNCRIAEFRRDLWSLSGPPLVQGGCKETYPITFLPSIRQQMDKQGLEVSMNTLSKHTNAPTSYSLSYGKPWIWQVIWSLSFLIPVSSGTVGGYILTFRS